MRASSLPLVLAILLLGADGKETSKEHPAEGPVRFTAVDVYADSMEKGLAAYQIEVLCDPVSSMITGVEGGETKHYAEAPYYDPAALHDPRGGRIIIASFTTNENPPGGRFRVARLHFRESGVGTPEYSARLMAAAAPGGDRITVKVEVIHTGDPK